ncbi:hypothetical protein FOA43_001529 [Brettanomyces nanus]|uniref:RNI-like protein n=1 Tax=Eeniella nana TaxID=13502 RepID=A0A875S1J3_EENNA|nr:uncharacterized protein FOA43_001529 [Brettanomyces nanus]QPG74205.1 hypothetical protein FOA43_001529 [Brettanomyces nanus]
MAESPIEETDKKPSLIKLHTAVFDDPGVSNGDVDWLFRGREVKKLKKKVKTVNTDAQSQLEKAQKRAKSRKSSLELSSSSRKTSPILTTKSTTKPVSPLSPNLPLPSKNSPLQPLKPSLKAPSSATGISVVSSSPPVLKPTSMAPSKSEFTHLRANSGSKSVQMRTSTSEGSSGSRRKSFFSSISSKLKGKTTSSEDAVDDTAFPDTSINPATAPVTDTQAQTPVSPPVSTPEPAGSSRSSQDSKGFLGIRKRRATISSITSSTSNEKKQPTVSEGCDPSNDGIDEPGHHHHHHHHHHHVHHHHHHDQDVETTTLSGSTSSETLDPIEATKRELEAVSFRRVIFALDKIPKEPQQQIPSRRPQKGNVVMPEDLTALPSKLSIGIADSAEVKRTGKVDPKELKEAKERQKYLSIEAKKHAEEAHSNALGLAKEVSRYKKWKKGEIPASANATSSTTYQDEVGARFVTGKLDIDTPLHQHVDYFDDAEDHEMKNKGEDECEDEDRELSLEELYSRCCHLREILPIPVTLKQLKGKTRPLHVLKMLNPRPTLIDVLSFSDFLALAPVVTVIFDNVTLTTEMLKTVLVSLSRSSTLEKLSLRNMPIDPEGWKWLCKFLIENKDISKLDISQQKIRADTPENCSRSHMDWDVFCNCIQIRGGIEELVINGCHLSTAHFRKLVEDGLSIGTRRLGVAATGLDVEKSTILSRWVSAPSTTCVGVDIAFNDLNDGQLIPFNDAFKHKFETVKLVFFSLNKTNITVEEAEETIKNLSSLKCLRFLDLGNDPQLFPGIIPTLQEYLPKFPELRRIHFEFDDLSEMSIVQLAIIFRDCPKLVHVSLLGNDLFSPKSSVALYGAVKSSGIYNLDLDYNLIGDELASKMAFYLMRNMEKFLNNNPELEQSPSNDEDLIFDGQMLARAAEDMLESKHKQSAEETAVIWKSLADRTIRLRQEIHHTIDTLFERREHGTLSIEGKENLLRLCLLDDSLENILGIFHEETNKVLKTSNTSEDVLSGTSERPGMMRRISNQAPLHEASTDIISTGPIVSPSQVVDDTSGKPTEEESAPHQVVEDTNLNTVDNWTGKPVLMRSASQTSIHGKQLEEEEGEFHKWGFFVQHQSTGDVNKKSDGSSEDSGSKLESSDTLELQKARLKRVNIPSGTALREAVMKAKGLKSISDLINKVSKSESPGTTPLVKLSSGGEDEGEGEGADGGGTGVKNTKNLGGPQGTAASMTTTKETSGSASTETDAAPSTKGTGFLSMFVPSEKDDSIDELVVKGHAELVYERLLDNAVKERGTRKK